MRVIDFHTHIYPNKIAEKATESTCDFYSLETELVGTSDFLLKMGEYAGISEFVLLPVATKPTQVRHINEFTANEVKAHRQFYGFGSLHAETENLAEEIDLIKSMGLKGIKIHPDIQRFAIDDERLFPVYEYISGKLPILIHCGDKRYNYSHPERLLRVINKFPKLQVVAAHLGGWSLFDTAFECLKNTNCYLDISSSTMYLTAEKVKEYIRGYGADRILFGSDFPLWNPKTELETFLNLGLSSEETEKIAYKNATEILNIK